MEEEVPPLKQKETSERSYKCREAVDDEEHELMKKLTSQSDELREKLS